MACFYFLHTCFIRAYILSSSTKNKLIYAFSELQQRSTNTNWHNDKHRSQLAPERENRMNISEESKRDIHTYQEESELWAEFGHVQGLGGLVVDDFINSGRLIVRIVTQALWNSKSNGVRIT